jgi:hypothetical protein
MGVIYCFTFTYRSYPFFFFFALGAQHTVDIAATMAIDVAEVNIAEPQPPVVS